MICKWERPAWSGLSLNRGHHPLLMLVAIAHFYVADLKLFVSEALIQLLIYYSQLFCKRDNQKPQRVRLKPNFNNGLPNEKSISSSRAASNPARRKRLDSSDRYLGLEILSNSREVEAHTEKKNKLELISNELGTSNLLRIPYVCMCAIIRRSNRSN